MTAESSSGELLLYKREDGSPSIEVRLEDETVWLSQQQTADLFQTTKQNVSLHVQNIFAEGELEKKRTVKKYLTVRQEGQRTVRRELSFYNLDLIISVGYRVRSKLATQFRIWATERLREYLVKGFTMDDDKLKSLGGGSYWRELLERIRDIRSSEKVLYRQILDLYATSVDYDPKADETTLFFKTVQNKLHYAAHGQTSAEVIASRANALEPNMGLTSFNGVRPRKADIGVAKNYLHEAELKKLNTLVSAYFDAAEFRAQNREPSYMKDWLDHLDRLIVAMGGPALEGAGKISRENALARAESEYARYRARLDSIPSEVEQHYLGSLEQAKRAVDESS